MLNLIAISVVTKLALKGRPVIARPNGPGKVTRNNYRPERPTYCFFASILGNSGFTFPSSSALIPDIEKGRDKQKQNRQYHFNPLRPASVYCQNVQVLNVSGILSGFGPALVASTSSRCCCTRCAMRPARQVSLAIWPFSAWPLGKRRPGTAPARALSRPWATACR